VPLLFSVDVSFDIQAASHKPSAIAMLKDHVIEAATSGAAVANVQSAANRAGVLVQSLQAMPAEMSAPDVTDAVVDLPADHVAASIMNRIVANKPEALEEKPTPAPTRVPTDAPTHMPTFHPCDDGSHSCDTGSTECTKDESSTYASEHDESSNESSNGHGQDIASSYSCACLEGFVVDLAAPGHDSCMATASPTLEPTAEPTTEPTPSLQRPQSAADIAHAGDLHHITASTLHVEDGGFGHSVGDMTSIGEGLPGWVTPAIMSVTGTSFDVAAAHRDIPMAQLAGDTSEALAASEQRSAPRSVRDTADATGVEVGVACGGLVGLFAAVAVLVRNSRRSGAAAADVPALTELTPAAVSAV
jgi:hypothetical protein